jgi:diguanylate cyclase (GGDEF)-like protein
MQGRTILTKGGIFMIRLLICDDSVEARSVLRTVLADQPEIEIVGEAADGGEAIAQAIALEPAVVLMDVSMPLVDGIAATRRIRELLPSTRVVAFAGSDDGEVVNAMLEAGAGAYCLKGSPLWELERAIAGAGEPLVRLAHALSRGLPGGVGHLVARELAELSAGLCAATYLTSADVGLSLAGIAGAPLADRLSSAPGVVLRAFNEASPARATPHELAELYRLGVPCGEALALPLLGDGERLGALLVAMPANVQFAVDAHLVSAVADLAAAALAQERRLALTFAEARRDALTGLPNRRAFDEQFREAFARAQANGRKLSLTLFDVDEFKQVNDLHGHAEGDDVLRGLSRVFLRTLRADEQIYRIGGDEFALLIEGTANAALRAAERVQKALGRQRRGRPLPTVSAGVAGLKPEIDTPAELTTRADQALYEAKAAGRNCASVHNGGPVRERRGHYPMLVPPPEAPPAHEFETGRRLRLLAVDDDDALLTLLRTTFEIIDLEVDEARSAEAAAQRIAAAPPDVIVLDVGMPGMDGLTFCRGLKSDPATQAIPIVILSGAENEAEATAQEAGAEAFLRKPFSPLELLAIVEQLAGGLFEGPYRMMAEERPEEQLLLYAHDLRRLLELERSQRLLLQHAYQETASALAGALESKDFGTGAHSKRVVRYAKELTRALDARLLENPSLEYGFLLHDVGKIAIPDSILQKPGRLTVGERRVMRSHTVLGAQLLAHVPVLQGPGLAVIRSHHERWDGSGYPDLLHGEQIPLGGRIFSVADALDAMTSDRPYRGALSWERASEEIVAQSGRQFDPNVVGAFYDCEATLSEVREELAAWAVQARV